MMPWVRIDDGFAQHPKVMRAGPLGMAMQIAALCYSNRNLTDGFIPAEAVPLLLNLAGLGMRLTGRSVGTGEDATGKLVAEDLVEAGLWHEIDGGYQIHDYADYQPTKAGVLAERAAARDRMKRGRCSGEVPPNISRSSPDVRKCSLAPVPVPVPVPAVLSEQEEGLRSGATPEPPTDIDSIADTLLGRGGSDGGSEDGPNGRPNADRDGDRVGEDGDRVGERTVDRPPFDALTASSEQRAANEGGGEGLRSGATPEPPADIGSIADKQPAPTKAAARRRPARSRSVRPISADTDPADLDGPDSVRRGFAIMWGAAKGTAYPDGGPADRAAAAKLLRYHGQTKAPETWRTWIAGIVATYLETDDAWIVDAGHPLSLLPRRLPGLVAKRAKKPVRPW